MTCSGAEGHPRYQAGDPEDRDFYEGERLYRRYMRDHFKDRQLLPAAFQFPRQSFNRQKYSAPEDVLHADCCDGLQRSEWGILECSATDLPTALHSANGQQYDFFVKHVPRECCYAHSEILCRCGGDEVDEPSRKVKETFRVLLALKMSINKEAAT